MVDSRCGHLAASSELSLSRLKVRGFGTTLNRGAVQELPHRKRIIPIEHDATAETARSRARRDTRVRHYSRRTEEAYVYWIRKYIVYHDEKHPSLMGATEIAAFLTSLAVQQQVKE